VTSLSSKSANTVAINYIPNSHTHLTCVSRSCFARCKDAGLLSRPLDLSSDADDNDALTITYTSLLHDISFPVFVHLYRSVSCVSYMLQCLVRESYLNYKGN